MANDLYKMVKGQRVALTSKEVKSFIMKANGWSSQEYQKKYDIFKNKVRAFENYEKAHGKVEKPQSPVEMLYKQAKAQAREGSNYKPSLKMQRIQKFTSVSSGKAGQRALESKTYQERRGRLYEDVTHKQFAGLIDKSEIAQEIIDTIEDPVLREQALIDYANAVRARIDEEGKAHANEAIPFGETFGSTDDLDFDLSPYM